jgi:hypothetical protein
MPGTNVPFGSAVVPVGSVGLGRCRVVLGRRLFAVAGVLLRLALGTLTLFVSGVLVGAAAVVAAPVTVAPVMVAVAGATLAGVLVGLALAALPADSVDDLGKMVVFRMPSWRGSPVP